MDIGTNRDHARAVARETIRHSNLETLEDRLTEALLTAHEDALRVAHDAAVRIGPYALRELRDATPADELTPEQWGEIERLVAVLTEATAGMIRSLLDDETPPPGGLYSPGPLPDEPVPFTPQPEAPRRRRRKA